MSSNVLESLFHMQIPVSSVREAAAWYAEHLGFAASEHQGGKTAFLNLPSGPMLMLWETPDATSANFTVKGETFPVLLYRTSEIHQLHDKLAELGVNITFFQDEGFGWVLKFYDPFGNMWGVIQEYERLPFQFGIGNVFVPVTNMPRAVIWYRELLGLKPDSKYSEASDPQERTVYAIRLQHVTLLLDSMKLETIVPSPNQLFTFETRDLKRAFAYLKDKSVTFTEPEETIANDSGRRAFGFKDSEGNVLIMHQGA